MFKQTTDPEILMLAMDRVAFADDIHPKVQKSILKKLKYFYPDTFQLWEKQNEHHIKKWNIPVPEDHSI